MTITRAYKFRVYPSVEQEHIINSCIGSSRFIYNHYLYENKGNKYFNYNEASKSLVNVKNEYPFLKEVDSCICQTTLKDLSNAYDKYNKGQGGYPNYKKRGYNGSYRTNAIRSTYKGKENCNIEVDLKTKTIKLPKLGVMSIRGYRNLKEFPYKILNVTVSKEANKYYASICVEEMVEEKEVNISSAIGVDLGVKTLVTTSDGIKYDKIDITREEKKLAKLEQKLSKQTKGSNNYKKTILKMERLHLKIRNKRKYYTHGITCEIVSSNDLIVTETLKVKEMIEKGKKHLSKYIVNSSLSEIIRQIKYKCKWNNKKLIQLGSYYASSQICNTCGYKESKVKDLSVRKWECPRCGHIHDRDINASLNIVWEGITKYYKEIYSV